MSAGTTAALVRPMAEADIAQAATVTAEAFGTDVSPAPLRHGWEQRLLHSLRSDAAGAFVTVRDGVITGAAQAVIRERLWVLSLMAVSPTLGRGGEGRALMQAALGYDRGCEGGLIVASDDPRALRLYASSGFALEAAFKVTGAVDRTLIPPLHPAITALLWYALARLPDGTPVDIGWISGRQQWALDVVNAARLSLTTHGAIAVRGNVGPLYPYIPSPPFA